MTSSPCYYDGLFIERFNLCVADERGRISLGTDIRRVVAASPLPSHVHIYVPDVDASYRPALAAGAESVREPVK